MHYTYVFLSHKDGGFYTGCTADLRTRLRKNTAGAQYGSPLMWERQ